VTAHRPFALLAAALLTFAGNGAAQDRRPSSSSATSRQTGERPEYVPGSIC